jgi:hypothetical protein
MKAKLEQELPVASKQDENGISTGENRGNRGTPLVFLRFLR